MVRRQPRGAGIRGGDVAPELVAVQRHPSLEAKRVARGQAAGFGLDFPPHVGRCRGGEHDFVARLPRVPRPRNHGGDAVDLRFEGAIVPESRHAFGVLRAEQGDDGLERLRPLHSYERPFEGAVDDGMALDRFFLGAPFAPAPSQLVDHRGSVGPVRDGKVPGLSQAVDDEIVDDPSVRREHHRIAGPPHRHRRRLRAQRVVKDGGCLRPLDLDLSHVGQIELSDRFPDRPVLFAIGCVPQRHIPPRERRHSRPGGDVLAEQRARTQFVHCTSSTLHWTVLSDVSPPSNGARHILRLDATAHRPNSRSRAHAGSATAACPPIAAVRAGLTAAVGASAEFASAAKTCCHRPSLRRRLGATELQA